MKIALIFPTWTDTYGGYSVFAKRAANWPPLNLCIVASLAEREGHDVIIIDAEAKRYSVEDTIDDLKEYNPDFIGFTANTPFYHVAADWAEEIKKIFPYVPTAVGGQHITVLKEDALLPGFDIGFVGEAEHAFPEFLKKFDKNKDYASWAHEISGLVYRQKNGVTVNTGRATPAYDINEMPVPSRHLLDMSLYTLGTEKRGLQPMTSIQTVRGCPFRCTFCSTKVFGTNFRRRSPKLVIEEIVDCYNDYGSRHFMFIDDTLTMHKKHFIDICDEILKAKKSGRLPKDISFEGQTRANVVDEEICEKMSEAGFVRLSFGLESVDSVVRKLMKKQVKIETYIKTYELTNKHGIETVTSTMIGQPGDNHETIKKTLSFLRWLKTVKRANMSIAVPYPGTELYEWVKEEKYGLKLLEPDFRKWRRYNVATMQVGDLSPEDLIEYQNDAYASIYLAPWRWKSLVQKDGIAGAWITFKRLISCIIKGRFEMLFISPNYWKSELKRDSQEVKEIIREMEGSSPPRKSPFSILKNVNTDKIPKKLWKIHKRGDAESSSGTMFTSEEKDIDKSVLLEEKEPHKITINYVEGTNVVYSKSFMTIPGNTLLESASSTSVEMPFSCKMGGCGSCKVKLIAGEVLLAGPHCLEESEVTDGFILACRSIAKKNLEIEIDTKSDFL